MKKKYLLPTIFALALAIVFSVILIERARSEIHCQGIEIRVLRAEEPHYPVVNTPVVLIALDLPVNGDRLRINTDGNGDSYFNLNDWPNECEQTPPYCCPASQNEGNYKAIVRHYCVTANFVDYDGSFERRILYVDEPCN